MDKAHGLFRTLGEQTGERMDTQRSDQVEKRCLISMELDLQFIPLQWPNTMLSKGNNK